MGSIGWPELLVVLIIALLLFGGTRLAGLGKASGTAIREFKEETKELKKDDPAQGQQPQIAAQPQAQNYVQPIPQPQQAQPYTGQPIPPVQPAQPVYDAQQPQPSYDPQAQPQNQQPPSQQQ